MEVNSRKYSKIPNLGSLMNGNLASYKQTQNYFSVVRQITVTFKSPYLRIVEK